MTAAERLALAFVADHPAAAARLLERADPADAAALLASVPAADAAAVYRMLAPSPAAACAGLLADAALAAILAALPLDAAAAALRRVEPDRRDRLLAGFDEGQRAPLSRLLAYPDHTAATLADPLALALAEDLTAAEAQRQLRGPGRHVFPSLYVVTRDHTLVGAVGLDDLMNARPKQTLGALAQRDAARLDAHTDLATLAAHPAWTDLDALPVVDGAGRLLGAIAHQAVRRLSRDTGRPMMATIVGLSELYWAGIAGMLASLVPGRTHPQEDDHVS